MTSSNLQTTNITRYSLQRFGILGLLYVLLIFILPPSQVTMLAHHLSAAQYRIVLLSLSLPNLVAWFAAFLGYGKLREYAHHVYKTDGGGHFEQLATGCAWLAYSLPLPAVAGLLLNSAANRWPHFHPTAIILSNYIYLILPLIAFSIIGSASRGLVSNAKLKFSLASSRLIIVLFLSAGVSYCYLTFRQFDLTSLHSNNNPYFLPLWLMVITVTIPFLYTWFVGLLAAYEISLYSKQVHGLLYRRSLRLMTGGLIAVIASSITLQYLNSVHPQVGYLVLDYHLLLTTLFALIGTVGFVLLALGATRLKRIEEV